MSGIATFDDLLVEIAAYTHRTDLVPRMVTFINMTEGHLNRVLLIRRLEAELIFNAATSPRALPADFGRLRQVSVNGRDIEAMSPAQVAQRYRNNRPGQSANYTIIGEEIFFYPFTAGQEVRLVYNRKAQALRSTNQSNDIISQHPELYLWGCLAEAFRFMQDYEASQVSQEIFERHIERANLEFENATYGDGLMMRAS